MLRHQFGQHFILRLDLLFQIRNPFLFGLMVLPSSLLESGGSVLEELLLPAVEHGWLVSQLVTGPRSALLPPNASSEWRPSLPACSVSLVSSCVRSVILTDERFLHFQLRQDTVTFKITIEATSPEGSPQAAQTGRDAHIGVAQDGGTVRKVVGRAGIEPATLSLEGRWDPFLPITVVVYGLCKHCIHAPSSMASECCRLLRFSARGPRYFPRYSLCRLSRRVGFREQFAL